MSAAPTSVPAVLAQASPTPVPNIGVDPNTVGPGLVALLIVVALGIALVLLLLSMRRQLRKVPRRFEGEGDDEPTGPGPRGRGPAGRGPRGPEPRA